MKLQTPSSSPKCMLYLETGSKPIRFIIQTRRLMYLQYILKEHPDSLISKFFHAQDAQPMKNDWALTCRKDIEELEINLSYEEIRNMSIPKFKTRVSKAVTKSALQYLLTEKNKLSKVLHIQYSKLKIQEYLLPNKTSLKLAKFIYHARNRMLEFKSNFGNKYSDLKCPVCLDQNSIDNQQHLLECVSLNDNSLVQCAPAYKDLFSEDLTKLIIIASVIDKKFKKRNIET